MLFLNKEHKIIKNIDGFEIEFRYPTLQDEIQIEAKKTMITRGQYMLMGLNPLSSSQNAIELTDAISTLSVVAKFTNPEYSWDFIVDSDGAEFVLKCYEEFNKWRLSFRERTGNNSKKES